MNKDLIIHLRLKGRALKEIAEELELPVSVVHLFFKNYVKELVGKWSASSNGSLFQFDNAYTNFNNWCEDSGYTQITIRDFKSAICMLENNSEEDMLYMEDDPDGNNALMLDINKIRLAFD